MHGQKNVIGVKTNETDTKENFYGEPETTS